LQYDAPGTVPERCDKGDSAKNQINRKLNEDGLPNANAYPIYEKSAKLS